MIPAAFRAVRHGRVLTADERLLCDSGDRPARMGEDASTLRDGSDHKPYRGANLCMSLMPVAEGPLLLPPFSGVPRKPCGKQLPRALPARVPQDLLSYMAI